MDEVSNPNLPLAGESSPTLRPVDEEDDSGEDSGVDVGDISKPGIDTAEKEGLDLSSTDEVDVASIPAQSETRVAASGRPPLKRESSAPPPQQPPPAPPSQASESGDPSQDPPDSLTLADLKRIRSTFPNAQPQPPRKLLEDHQVYDFEYQDAQSFSVELEEWFSYSEEEEQKLRKCRDVYDAEWSAFCRERHPDEEESWSWQMTNSWMRDIFIQRQMQRLSRHCDEWQTNLMTIVHLALGVWDETAGHESDHGDVCAMFNEKEDKAGTHYADYTSSGAQIHTILDNVQMLHKHGALVIVYDTLRAACEADFTSTTPDQRDRNIDAQPGRPGESMTLWCSLTLLYLFVEVARTSERHHKLQADIRVLQPNLLKSLTEIVARLRWEENAPIPLTKMLLLAWKTILVCFGGIADIDNVKKSVHAEPDEKDQRGQPVITASPLDYHLFRQEISSKYPAYQPPPPLFPLEPENNSILPPLKHRRPSYAASDSAFSNAPSVGTHSIMHQPVHIATPAPSPPPSPAAGGKTGKKQNYQTNQMFPFLYPPLDPTSNELGGKGSTELQDALAGRKWEGSDIPASILEAAELFATRMRATRAMKQLWEARVDYMKFERGWRDAYDNADVDDFELVEKPAPEETAEQGAPAVETDEQRRLRAVGDFYKDSLPHLQSVVIVLLKAVLQNVTDLVTKGNGQNGLQAGIQFNDANGINGSARPIENGNGNGQTTMESTAEELNNLRSQEIAAKALSAILLLLLKWFKVSHILQYEYMTQLLLDSNYVPLILKLWQTQDIGRACHYELDREELNFFYFCQANSRNGLHESRKASKSPEEAPESPDEAAPPPIKLRRDSPSNPLSPTTSAPDFAHPPEVDELGYPQTALPTTPLTTYSWRNVFASINYLRILQKITRRKTHRALLLVSYKSSNHLKKSLRIPIQPLRYYTLKLFKSQVPFCGRKWRQGNMKIITAVWLSVPAELRDDWLTGGGGGMGGAGVGDVDGTVEEALPLEQSLRALTHWWNVRFYPEVMGVERGLLEEEMDYFAREIEKMELFREEGQGGEEVGMEEGGGWSGPVEGY